MKLKYNDKELELVNCKTFFQRLKGFMFTNKVDKALLFDKCNSIHTFFMKKNIDIIMCDKDNNILYYYPNLSKNNVILPKKKVKKVYETPVEYFDIKINTKIKVED